MLEPLNGRAMELLADVGLRRFAEVAAGEISYGRKRALEIATTLALDPQMLLLDEPMAGMGHEDIERTAALIQRVSVNRTILMVEHNLQVVANLSRHDHRAHPRAGARRRRLRRRVGRTKRSSRPISESGMLEAPAARGPAASGPPSSTVAGLQPGTANRIFFMASTSTCGEGEVVTLLGRNGAGKTTTLKSIMGIVGKRIGSAKFAAGSDNLATSTASRGSALRSVPRNAAFSRSFSVKENLLLPPQVATTRRPDAGAHLHAFSQFAERLASGGSSLLAASSRCSPSREFCEPAHAS